MTYTLVKALTSRTVIKEGSSLLPIIGYVLFNHNINKMQVFKSDDAYDLVLQRGGRNIETTILKEIIDGKEHLFYGLKLTDGTNFDTYILSVD